MEKLPPQNLDAERAFLGSLMLKGEVLDEVQDLIRPEDFYGPTHREIYEAILALGREGSPVDVVTVATRLGCELERIGGAPALGAILETVGHASHAEYYAELIVAKANLRQVIFASRKAQEDAYRELEPSEIIAEVDTTLHGILDREVGDSPLVMEDLLEQVFANLDGGEVPGLPTGLERLDELYRPRKSNLIVLAARPSMGKTGLAVSIALNIAESGTPIGLISLEMKGLELASRFLSSYSQVSSLKLDNREPLEDQERLDLLAKSSQLSALPIYQTDKGTMTMGQIAAKARLWKRRHNIGVLFVDYLQLIKFDDRKMDREQQVSQASRALKSLAGDLDIPVIVLSQLNRQVDKRPDKRPLLSDLRESGAIEQDADVVILIHRPEYYNLEDDPGVAELIVAKNRNGLTGTAKVQFEKSTVTFRNLAPKWQSGWVGDDF